MADQVSLIKGIGSAIGRSLGAFPKIPTSKNEKSSKKRSSKTEAETPKPSASAKPAPRSKKSGPTKRDATFKDAASAVSEGKITRLDAIQISPTYARKYATKVEDTLGGY